MYGHRTIEKAEGELLVPQLIKWFDERLRQNTPEFIRMEVKREEAALSYRLIQINKRLFEIEVIVKALDQLDGADNSETNDLKTESVKQCNIALIKTTKGE